MTLPKKILIPCLSLSFSLLSLFFFCVPTSFAKPHDPPFLPPRVVCTGDPIPNGWIVREIFTNWGECKHHWFNNVENTVFALRRTQSACSISPIPTGFVVLNQTFDPQDCGLPTARITLAPASGSQMTVCASSPIPAKWVITAELRTLDRPQAMLDCVKDAAKAHGLGIVQRKITAVTGHPIRVCADSPVPSGYHRIKHITVPSCHNDPAGTSTLIAPVS